MSDTSEFFSAIRDGNATVLDAQLAADPSLASAEQDGVSAILFALYHGKEEFARRFVRSGVEPGFFEAAALGDLGRVSELLAADPLLAASHTPDGFGALGLAAFFGHERVVALLARWCDPNTPSANRMRAAPLHSATATLRPEAAVPMTRALLAQGADPNLRQEGGYTPLHAAAAVGNTELVRLLLAHGADHAVRTDAGHNAADLAAEKGHHDLAAELAPP
ncbi:MAG: ankyrin repeat domain-containing protein [Gemmatimonadales bacterium]